MRRRDFISGILLSGTTGRALAQLSTKRYRIAILDPLTPVTVMNETAGPDYPLWGPLFKELHRLGYVEGQNLIVERYGVRDYSSELARKVNASNPDLIFADGDPAVHDLMTATDAVPIVGAMAFPLQSGRVTNLAHPGGNLTGISIAPGIELYGKRLELLQEMVPKLSRVGFLTLRENWERNFKTGVEKLAKELGLAVVGPFLETPATKAEIGRVIAAMSKARVDALNVTADVWMNTPLVIGLAQEFRLPAMYVYRYFAQIGGLMAYDYGLSDMGRIVADQIDQILKGTKPGEIPIYQAQKFTLTINLKTAKALGLTVPQALLVRADEVIE
jgi:putative tryptophan/tyrosine transport system substrate-binding protein